MNVIRLFPLNFFTTFLLSTAVALAAPPSSLQERADRFLGLVNAGYQALYRVNNEAQWLALTDVTPAHDAAAEWAGKANAAFDGNPAVIKEARELLEHREELDYLSVRQLSCEKINAAKDPMT